MCSRWRADGAAARPPAGDPRHGTQPWCVRAPRTTRGKAHHCQVLARSSDSEALQRDPASRLRACRARHHATNEGGETLVVCFDLILQVLNIGQRSFKSQVVLVRSRGWSVVSIAVITDFKFTAGAWH